MKSNLLQEALADARAVKETALANAKLAIEETFQPTLQRMISSKLAEEEGEDEEDIDIDINFDEPEPDVDVDVDSDMPEEDDEVGMGSFEDDDEPAEDDDALESILRELEGEEDFDVDEGQEDDWSDPIQEEDDEEFMEEEDEMYEELYRELTEEDDEEFMEEEDEMYEESRFNRRPKNEGSYKRKYHEAIKVVSKLKSVINEVNLLNAKLMYNSQLQRDFELSTNQKQKCIEALDNANSVREVKLIYNTIKESLNRPKRKQVTETVTRPMKKASTANQFNFVPRWQQLAGLKPIED